MAVTLDQIKTGIYTFKFRLRVEKFPVENCHLDVKISWLIDTKDGTSGRTKLPIYINIYGRPYIKISTSIVELNYGVKNRIPIQVKNVGFSKAKNIVVKISGKGYNWISSNVFVLNELDVNETKSILLQLLPIETVTFNIHVEYLDVYGNSYSDEFTLMFNVKKLKGREIIVYTNQNVLRVGNQTLTIFIANTLNKVIRNIYIVIRGSNVIVKPSVIHIDKLSPFQVKAIPINVFVTPYITKSTTIQFELMYYVEETQITSQKQITFLIRNEPKLIVIDLRVEPKVVNVNETSFIYVTLVNSAYVVKAYNVSVNVHTSNNLRIIGEKLHYIGTLDPGSSYIFSIPVKAISVGVGKVYLEITYYDVNGLKYKLSKVVEIQVKKPEKSGTMSKVVEFTHKVEDLLKVLIVVAIIVIIVAVVLVGRVKL